MLNNTVTIEELRTYLCSLEEEETKEKLKQINIYKEECINEPKQVNAKDISEIFFEGSERRKQTKDKILKLLKECKQISQDIEEAEITKYMIYRVDIKSAERILTRVIKRLKKEYERNIDEIFRLLEMFPKYKDIEIIDDSEYTNTNSLNRAKMEYVEEYTDKQRNDLVQKELEVIEKAKIINSKPIPHEILKDADKELQSKMQKYNSIRQKRIIILSSMKADYLKLAEPREINCMIDDALLSVDTISEILTVLEYRRIKHKLLKARKKIFRSTNEIRSIIKYKEKKTGINSFNIQEARFERMELLRNKLQESNIVIETNDISKLEEELKELNNVYAREKQFADIMGLLSNNENDSSSNQLSDLNEQISSIKQRIENSKIIIEEEQIKIKDLKEELFTLWRIEIESTTSNKKEPILELAENNESHKEVSINKRTFLGLKKIRKAKHELV